MCLAVLFHYVEDVIRLALPSCVSSNTIEIVENDGRGRRASVALEEYIDICTQFEGLARTYASDLEVCFQFGRFVFSGLQLLKGDVII